MNILLTGGTGFVGKSLLASGEIPPENNLFILSRRGVCPEFSNRQNTRFLAGDVRTFTFPEEPVDFIIHAAAPSGSRTPDEEMASIITDGTRNVLEQSRGRGIQKILFISSGAVYGPLGAEPVAEDAPLNPVTPYGIAKLEAEKMCLKSGIPTVIARCFAFMGEFLPRNVHFAAGNFLEDLLNRREIIIKGDGRPVRSYMEGSTLAKWLWYLFENGIPGEAYNVGSPDGVSIRELAETIASFAQPPVSVKILGVPGEGPVPGYVPDISKALALGLPTPEPLCEVIRITLEKIRQADAR